MSFMSLFEIISVVKPDFLWIAESVSYACAVNPNGIKRLLANGLGIFPVKDNPFSVMVLKVYLKILLIILFDAIEFLITLVSLNNHLQKLYKVLKLVY